MHLIDSQAYGNRLRLIDPALKAGLSGSVLLICLIASQHLINMIAVLWLFVLGVVWARLPVRLLIGLLAAEGSFLLVSVLGILITVTSQAPSTPSLGFGSIWLTILPESFYTASGLVSRALACASALNFLALTTPIVDLIDLGRRLHIPELLLDIMTLIYRSIFSLFDSLEQMRFAQEARLGYETSQNAMRSAALIASNLLVETFRRSQRLQVALDGRCYDGTLRVLPSPRLRPWAFYGVSTLVVGSLLLCWSLLS